MPVSIKLIYRTCLWALLAVITGCARSGNNFPNDLYSLTGSSDVTVQQYKDTTFTVAYHISFPADRYEPVTFSIEDLPPGITATPRMVTDTTSFSVIVTYTILMDASASFPVHIHLYSASQGKRSYSFNVVVTPVPEFSYAIRIPETIQLPMYSDTILRLPVTVAYRIGLREPVVITPVHLPLNITVSPTAINGTPTFTDTFAFHVTANQTGNFPVAVHGTSAQGTQAALFSINVNATDNCAAPLADVWTGTTTCVSYAGPGTGISTAGVFANGSDDLLINLPFASVTAELNCSAATLNMLPSSAGSLTFAGGTGSFTANTIVLTYALSGIINSTCTTVLTR